MPLTILILIVVFGALVAVGVPLVLAITSIIVALGLTAIVGRFTDLSFYVVNMITMIGLAVGIDYTLFIVSRYREERRRGHTKYDAIEIAGGTATKAVVFSGATVVLALMGMFLIPLTVFHSLGAGAVLAWPARSRSSQHSSVCSATRSTGRASTATTLRRSSQGSRRSTTRRTTRASGAASPGL